MEQIILWIALVIILLIIFATIIIKIVSYSKNKVCCSGKEYHYTKDVIISNSADISFDDELRKAKEDNFKSFNC